MALLYAQYGCGFCAPTEWLNFDCSPTLRFERLPVIGRLYTRNGRRFPDNVRFGNIVKGLPLEPMSCQGVYASHVLEHLALDDFHRALNNTKTVLVRGGIFRLVVPDLEWAMREYLKRLESQSGSAGTANNFFLKETMLGCQERRRGLRGASYSLMSGGGHLWMWDARSLHKALTEHGFTDIRRCSRGDASDPMFNLVENDPDRFEKAVAMEAKRA